VITPNGLAGGLFRSGNAFVLQSMGMHPRTEFRVIRTGDLGIQQSISLKGTFAYDALSPSGSRLYLIQHSSVQDLNHYVVRAYDLKSHKLMPGRIADKTQKGWVMQGWPVAQTTTEDGRWVYTLYTNPGGTPFVHALDTVKGVAHCVGFAWPATQDQDPIFNFTLAIDGPKLVLRNDGGSVYRVIDRKTWQVTAR